MTTTSGDGWTHTVTVEKIVQPEPGVRYPRFISGLEALADPAHPEHDLRMEWAGRPFDPAAFDLDEVNKAMAWLAWPPLPASRRGST
jgi:hypothetical protein